MNWCSKTAAAEPGSQPSAQPRQHAGPQRRRGPSRFVLTVLTLSGLLHLWIGWCLLPDMKPGAWGQAGMIGVLALSFLLLPAGFYARGIRRRPLSDLVAWAGFLAMGFFSSLFVLTILRELLMVPFRWISSPGIHAAFAQDSALAVAPLAALLTLIGLWNARRQAQVVDVEIPIGSLPQALQEFTIVQISDVHVGPTIKRRHIERMVARVNGLSADLIAITGDLVDGSVPELAEHTEPLARLEARHGTYFVTGNHEYYSGAAAWIHELRRLGVRVLLNEHVVLEHQGATLVLAGVTDYSARHIDPRHDSDPRAALAGAPRAAGARVLLAHQPRSAFAAEQAGFDLQLSGHTHGGQFFPWNFFVRLQQPFTAGLNRMGGMWVYTSRGTGYWGPPKRLGAPSEISRIRLVRAEA